MAAAGDARTRARLVLSADLGEGAPEEPEVWPFVDAVNVACGGHVGDEASMTFCVLEAKRRGVVLGAHPSYPDREGFGRRHLDIPPDELRNALVQQLRALRRIAMDHGLRLAHAKAHGALYNDAHIDASLARIVVDALREADPQLAIVAPAKSRMRDAADVAGLRIIREAFADRRYMRDGSLQPRSVRGSLLSVEESAQQVAMLLNEGSVVADDATRISLDFDTICVHADLPGAPGRLRAIRALLEND